MWLETDAFAAEDYLYLGSDKRAQLGELVPMFVNRQGPVWVVTAHGLVHLNGLEPQQIRDALQERWAGTKQVDVRPLYDHRTVSQNIGSIVMSRPSRWVQLARSLGGGILRIPPWLVPGLSEYEDQHRSGGGNEASDPSDEHRRGGVSRRVRGHRASALRMLV
jgi:hypothetical protein